MLEDAIDHAEEDIDERLLIAARVEGEQILHHKKALAKDGDLLEGDEETVLSGLAAEPRPLSGTDRQRIRELGNQVDEKSAAFAQRRIDRDRHCDWREGHG